MRHSLLLRTLVRILFLSIMVARPAGADTGFTDPSGRFHGQVPPNWTVETGPDQPLGLRSRGNILVTLTYTEGSSVEGAFSVQPSPLPDLPRKLYMEKIQYHHLLGCMKARLKMPKKHMRQLGQLVMHLKRQVS